jgi:hypothetical protein
MPRYAKAFAWMNGDSRVTPAHLKTILPYLLWHKVQPTQKAIAENKLHANDRVDFIRDLIGRIETEYIELTGNAELLQTYAAALNVIRTETIRDKKVSPDQVRNVVKNAITKIGNVDKPYALTLAHHISSEYNTKLTHEYDSQ